MLVKVQGVSSCNYSNEYLKQKQHEVKTKFYNSNTPVKKEVKEDFGAVLDEEMKKLHFEMII